MILELVKLRTHCVHNYIPQNLVGTAIKWARFRITGARRLIGVFLNNQKDEKNKNVFYIVFLDKDHKFAPSTKKHT